MIVDDDPLTCDYHTALLARAGIETYCVTDPLKAMEVLQKFRPDLVLMDVAMPRCSGLELAAVIRREDDFARLPIVFVSSDEGAATRAAALRAGGDFFFSKPVDTDTFADALTERIRRARSMSALEQERRAVLNESEYLALASDKHNIISTTDASGVIQYVNDEFCHISGYAREELLGHTHGIINSGHHPRKYFSDMWRTIARGDIWQGEIHNRCKDGSDYWVKSTILPVSGEMGRPAGYISVRTDITDVKNAELAAKSAEHRLQIQQQALMSLATHEQLDAPDPDTFRQVLTRTVAQTLDVAYAGIWLLDEAGEAMQCVLLFSRDSETITEGAGLSRQDFPVYFDALQSRRVVAIEDAHLDTITREFSETYLRPHGIGAILDAPIRRAGQLAGVVCCQHVGGRRTWLADEQSFAAGIADVLGLQLEAQRRRAAERSAGKRARLLALLHTCTTRFISSPSFREVAEDLLQGLLQLTDSRYGFISEVGRSDEGSPYLKTHAISNIAWDADSARLYAESTESGIEFHNLDTLYGAVIREGQIVIANDPVNDPRSGGLPEGHPPIDSFLGVPVYYDNRLVAMYALANRPQGYDTELSDFLQPFSDAYGVMVEALHAVKREKSNKESLVDARDEAERANRAKSQFLSSMSHELRTPLNAILGFSQLLEIEQLEQAQHESVQEISQAGRHLLELINQVLDLARIEAGRINLDLKTISLRSVLDECRSMIGPLLDKYWVTLECSYDCCRDVLVHADFTRLKQALLNILSNGCKYNRNPVD